MIPAGLELYHYFIYKKIESTCQQARSVSDWPSYPPSIMITSMQFMIVRLSLLRKTILIPEYLAFMCVCVFVDGCISQF